MWEMRLKYEREKRKKLKTQKTATASAATPKSSMESLSVETRDSGGSVHTEVKVTQESELWNAVERNSPKPEKHSPIPPKRKSSKRQSLRSSTPEPTSVPNSYVVEKTSHVPAEITPLSPSHSQEINSPKLESRDRNVMESNNASAINVEVLDNLPSPTELSSKEELADIEVLVIHRLPGEKLGMGLSIESQGDDNDPVEGVFVQNITPGGAADKATGGKHGICIGDEILEINGTPMNAVSYSETIAFFRELPLRMILRVKRVFSSLPGDVVQELPPPDVTVPADVQSTHTSQTRQLEVPDNFELVDVSFNKGVEESLGLSIMPSYGSTQEYYQVCCLSCCSVCENIICYILFVLRWRCSFLPCA
jgi:hypothetical protein